MDYYLARQPVVDQKGNVIAYELLHRTSEENMYTASDPDEATRQVLETTYQIMGIDTVSHGLPIFVNFTRDLIVNYLQLNVPPGSLIVEVLETVEMDEELLKALRHMKKAGYQIALDDFNCNASVKGVPELVRLADFIKIDFRAPLDRQHCSEKIAKRSGKSMIAEKIETLDDYTRAIEGGYSYFQGYFFGKPEVLCKKTTPLLIDGHFTVHIPHV